MKTTNPQTSSIFGLTLMLFLLLFAADPLLADVSIDTQQNGISISQVEKGHEFLLRVFVADAADLYGSAFDIAYDPNFLQVIDTTPLIEKISPKVIEGELLNESGAAATLLLAALENNKNGRLVVGISRKGAVSGVNAGTTGSLIASAHFQAIRPSTGPITINFSTPGLKDSSGGNIQMNNWQTANLTVLDLIIQKLDVNDDESINLQDLILAIQVQTQILTSQKVYPEAGISRENQIGMPEALAIIQVIAGSRTAP